MASGDATIFLVNDSESENHDETFEPQNFSPTPMPGFYDETVENLNAFFSPTALNQRRLQDKNLFLDIHENDLKIEVSQY